MADEPMNVAFKLNWVYGEDGPWTTPCTPEGRRRNVGTKVWCSQPQCQCQKLVETEERLPRDESPCMDLSGYRDFSLGGGVYHSGSRQGTGIEIHNTAEGKFAILTSRRHDWSEEDRIIIAWFQIDRLTTNEKTGESKVSAGDSPYAMRVPTDHIEEAPRYWDFRDPEAKRSWRSGLFRYIPDDEADAMREAVAGLIGDLDVEVWHDIEAQRIESEYLEGRQHRVLTNHRERNPELRSAAIRIHGTTCQACGFNFGDVYGPRGEGFIEVHHLRPLADYKGEETVDPRTEMAVLCSNCHDIVHRDPDDVLTIEQVRLLIETHSRR